MRNGLHLVLQEDSRDAAALALWLTETQGIPSHDVEWFAPPDSPGTIAERFLILAAWIDQRIEARFGSRMPKVAAFTDLPPGASLNHLSPIGHRGWSTLVGMLVLAYPEIHWLFCSTAAEAVDLQTSDGLTDLERLRAHFTGGPTELRSGIELFDDSLTPIFDRTGLRNRVRAAMAGPDPKPEVVRRAGSVIAIDEEQPYAWLHAYIGYRFGYLAAAVTNLAGMRRVASGTSPIAFVFEDLCVEFPDDDDAQMHMERRRDHFPWLTSEGVNVTSGARLASGSGDGTALAARLGRPEPLVKPVGGMFQVRSESRLPSVVGFESGPRSSPTQWLRRWAAKEGKLNSAFIRSIWPRASRETHDGESTEQATEDTHAAPGRILLIAERLIARALPMASGCDTVPKACHGAVLASDAFELLANRTPTLALGALSLKHQFEVLAECRFIGMRHHFEVGARLEEISHHVSEATSRHGKEEDQHPAALNAELAIVSALLDILRLHNRFDEEQKVLSRARALHREILLTKFGEISRKDTGANPIKKVKSWAVSVIIDISRPFASAGTWYMVKIMTSPTYFIVGIVCWILALGLGFAGMVKDEQGCYVYSDDLIRGWTEARFGPALIAYKRGIMEALTTFLSIQPANATCAWESWAFLIILATMIAGLTHLGVLISYLYSVMARR